MKKVTGRTRRIQSYMMLSLAIAAWLAMPVYADGNGRVVTRDIIVQATRAEEEAKYESQQTSIITSKEIEKKQKLIKYNIALIIALFLETVILVLLALNFK